MEAGVLDLVMWNLSGEEAFVEGMQDGVVVEAVHVFAEAKGFVPLEPGSLPVFVPLALGAGLDEELHLHLLELAHPEDELPRNDFVAEGLADLSDAERQLHTAALSISLLQN